MLVVNVANAQIITVILVMYVHMYLHSCVYGVAKFSLHHNAA